MEENPPTPAGSDKPRSRTPRAAFSTPEQAAPSGKSPERGNRRAAKAAPPVTFQPPSADDPSGTRSESATATPGDRGGSRQQPGRGRKAAPRKGGVPGGGPRKRGGSTAEARPGDESGATAVPAEAGPAEAQPAGGTPAKTQPAKAGAPGSGPAKAAPAKATKATPAKAAPAKATPAKKAAAKAAPGKTAPVKAAPAHPASAAPQKAGPATVAEAETTPMSAPGEAGPAKAAPSTVAQAESTPAETPAADTPTAGSGPVKAAPPRTQGVEGAPTPGDAADVTGLPPAEAADTPTKATPAKKTARKAAKPPAPPSRAQEDADTAARDSTPVEKEGRPANTDREPAGADSTPTSAAAQAEGGPAEKEAAEGEVVPAPERTTAPLVATVRTEAWAKLIADPGHAPELLALAAVQTIGPRAEDWLRRSREAYPDASPEALARLAQEQFTRFGSIGSLFAAVAGSYAPVALLASNALTYAELVLHIAAAYGVDPTDERRAADLLVLAGIHPEHADAEAALAAARQPAYEDDTTLSAAVWRLGRMVAVQAAAWVGVRAVNRVFPGTALLAAVMTSRNGARTMAGKASRFYQGGGATAR